MAGLSWSPSLFERPKNEFSSISLDISFLSYLAFEKSSLKDLQITNNQLLTLFFANFEKET